MENRIKELRLQKEMTLLQLADKLGVSESTAQRYESGNIKNLKYETMIKLASIFDCQPGYVMGWDEQKFKPQEEKGPEEFYILKDFQKLNDIGKEKVKIYICDLLDNEKYTKEV